MVITTGGPQSNHARQTAAAAAKLGLECELVLPHSSRWHSPLYDTNGNALLDRLFGARVQLVADRETADATIRDRVEALRSAGRTPYFIPTGGSTPLGALGYVDAAAELVEQVDSRELKIDYIIVVTGSCTTHAGIITGLEALDRREEVIGVTISLRGDSAAATVRKKARDTAELLDMPLGTLEKRVTVKTEYLGPGYGEPTDAMIEAVELTARTEGILLDPVYTGKAMSGLIDLVRQGLLRAGQNVVFWHTGGTPALFPYESLFPVTADAHAGEAKLMSSEWSNWSGSVRCTPAEIAAPASEDELAQLVARAARDGKTVRVTGSGHSFTPLCATGEVLVSLDNWQGVESADAATSEATIRGGSKISSIGKPLRQAGLAMPNQGDVDVQSIAGALSTGTHGTGRTLGNLSTQIIGLRLIDAGGNVVEYNAGADDDILRAARVSVGTLGVISAARLKLIPAYRLHEQLLKEPIEDCLAKLDERIAANRHFEFFWYPASDLAHVKILNPTDAAPGRVGRHKIRADRSFVCDLSDGAKRPLQRDRILLARRVWPGVLSRNSRVDAEGLPARQLAG